MISANRWNPKQRLAQTALLTFIAFCITAIGFTDLAFSQFKSVAVAETHSDESGIEFGIQTAVNLGLSGFQYTTEFHLRNELGMHIDTISMLKNSNVRESIGMEEEEYVELYKIYAVETEQLKQLIATGQRTEIEARFRALNTQLVDQIGSEMADRLDQTQLQQAIEKHGLEKSLGARPWRDHLDITDDQLKALSKNDKAAKSSFEKISNKLRIAANEKFLEELDPDQRRRFDKLILSLIHI